MNLLKKVALFISSFVLSSLLVVAQEIPYTATTTANAEILTKQLALLLKPLYKEEVLIEAIAWRTLLKDKVTHISAEEIAVQEKNIEIKHAKEITEAIEEAEESIDDAEKHTDDNQNNNKHDEKIAEDLKAVATAIQTSTDHQENDSLAEVVAKATEQTLKNEQESKEKQQEVIVIEENGNLTTPSSEEKTNIVETITVLKDEKKLEEAIADVETTELADTDKLSDVKEQATQVIKAKKSLKEKLLKDTTTLRNERTALIDRLKVVLKDLEAKGGKKESQPFYAYINAVDEIKIDVTDTASTWVTMTGWLVSSEGGMRWAKNAGIFCAILILFWVLSLMVSGIVHKLLSFSKNTSALLQDFFSKMIKRLIILAGFLVALTTLEVNLTPLLAMIGATGLIVGFALKDTLGNFASGLMILTYHPFDVGDFIRTNDIKGTVTAMNLVSTTVLTADNQRIIIPNNSVWHNMITNINSEKLRRIDLVFKVGYQDDLNQTQQILTEVVKQHPQVLQNEEIIIRVHELADSSVNFVCRSWVNTDDYWQVRSELIHTVKDRFKVADISVPYLQTDVHLHQST